MDYKSFITQVQSAADLDDQDEAVETTQVVLGVLGERLYWAEREELAAQLAPPLKEYLSPQQGPENTRLDVDRFSLEEFYHRVGARLDIGYPEAMRRAKRVTTTLRDAVTESVIEGILSKLPAEYRRLFDKEQSDK
jgi:uncharacterized protein (DUF2267 family)